MNKKRIEFYVCCFLLLGIVSKLQGQQLLELTEQEKFQPLYYRAFQPKDTLVMDGQALEASWKYAQFTDAFIDIEGTLSPLQTTKVKMLWDKQYLYIYALLEENHVWASIQQRDAVIFHDNDFEVFIDPSNDTYDYTELEINALNTVWDLKLNRPYRMKGWAHTAYNLEGIKTAVHIYGSLNNPEDIDTAWSVEIAIPMNLLMATFSPRNRYINKKSIWRINFSRVQWQHELINGQYQRKKIDGKLLSEYNWVWSPQHAINMHIPEKWGYLQFDTTTISASSQKPTTFEANVVQVTAYALMRRVKFGTLRTFLKLKAGEQKTYTTLIGDTLYNCLFLKTFKGFEWQLINLKTNQKYTINDLGKFKHH